MSTKLLNSEQAADALGISVPTLYDWLSQSDRGDFAIRGVPVTISYLQGGRRGQGRIKVAAKEVERLLELMRVSPKPKKELRKRPVNSGFSFLKSKPGRPDE
ncbi:DNA-binding protein [Bremerella sp.]|uniref:DNA-binding protein n=1 Tax=Bremerella sp. TaxID=2795602 RepID=UPI003918A3DE